MTNDKLPEEIMNEISEKAHLSTDFLSNDESKTLDYLRGYKQGWKEGATAWAPWKIKHDEMEKWSEKLRLALVMAIFALKQSYDVTEYPADGQTNQDSAIRIGEEALQQFKDGTKQVELSCMACGTKFMGPEPKMCCSGRDCGCMGMPIDPIVCSKECYENLPHRKKDGTKEVEHEG